MAAERALDILSCLEAHGVVVWLDGGWGVDAHLGQQTRAHDDLDVIVEINQVLRVEAALNHLGYETVRGGPPTCFEMVDSEGHQVDVHPATLCNDDRAGVYRMENGQDWIYPKGAFSGAGTISGQRVRCVTPDVMLICHTTGYALDEAHEHDAVALSERFGIHLPEFRRASRDAS